MVRRHPLTDIAPFLLEVTLRAQGAEFSNGSPCQPHIVSDGLLITGQNPASSERTAHALLSTLTG